MKKTKIIVATVLASLIMSSCIGSFKLTNQLLDWNKDIGGKFANEVVFVAFHVVPIYPVCYLADVLVLNSVEFWNDGDAFAMKSGDIREVEHNGIAYKITKKRTSFKVEQVDDQSVFAEFSYDRMKKSWRLKSDNYNEEILRFLDDNKVEVSIPNSKKQVFDINEQGIAELNSIVNSDIPVE
jgi:Domain of unknown function (DUF3332).